MEQLIIVRGGGDMATGTIHKLWSAGFPVLILETEYPAAIRRQVALSEAVYQGEAAVEGLTAVRIGGPKERWPEMGPGGRKAAGGESIGAAVNGAEIAGAAANGTETSGAAANGTETAGAAANGTETGGAEASGAEADREEALYEAKIKAEWEAQIRAVHEAGKVPIMVDPSGRSIGILKPDVVVDAIIAKENLGTSRSMAPLTIALGPGFTAGLDVDAVIETKRGHNLGRIIRQGEAAPNTGIPGNIGGYTAERVIHAGTEGILKNVCKIGDIVSKGDEIARIEGKTGSEKVEATIDGVIRGLIRDGFPVTEGFKIADIDPRREELINCFTISDKARCIAGSVLEVVCGYFHKRGGR